MTAVEARGVSVRYGTSLAVDDVSLRVASGEFLALLGPNGSGKSSLLSVFTSRPAKYTGTVELDGRRIDSLSMTERSLTVGVLRQADSMIPEGFTVRELVGLGLPVRRSWSMRADDPERIAFALDRTGASALADRDFTRLSGGERQRVLLARAIVCEPGLLVLDEPTNHLDVRHRFDLLQLVAELSVTVIAALHDIDLAMRYADSALVLQYGRAVGSGHPTEVLSPELMRSVFCVDADRVTDQSGRARVLLSPFGERLHASDEPVG